MTDERAVSQGCAVIGGGPAGLIAALALAHFKVPTTLVARRPATIDNRTTALLAGSVAALEAVGVWEACRAHAAPLRARCSKPWTSIAILAIRPAPPRR